MQFPKSFFEDEVIDGFYVPSMMKKAWAAQLEVLEDIDKVCKKHGIKYFAEWGTVLGAVRHGGFIPWDDDMDICMLRADYEKFCEVALDDLPSLYGLLNFEHSDDDEYKCDDFLTRVYSGNRIRMDKAYLEKFHGFPYVAGMDVFPLDYMPSNVRDDKMLCEQLKVLSALASSIDFFEEEEKEEYIRNVEDVFDTKIDRNKSLRRQIYMLADRLCGMIEEKDAEYITALALRSKSDYKIPKKCYETAVLLPFENTEIPVPSGYDTILKAKYGNYMKPVRDGGAHEYPFYKKQQAVYEEKHEPLFKCYQFSEDDLKRNSNEENMSIKDIARNMLMLFEQAHENMCNFAEKGMWQEVVALTEDCQDGAIALGTNIESIKDDGHPIVKLLEEYCEVLYSIHETIFQEGALNIEVMCNLLQDIFNRMKSEIEASLLSRREVVFLPFKYNYWNALKSVWEEACADPMTDVYVVPIPYYYKDTIGTKSELYYDGQRYPENVHVCDYNTFNFGLHQPDVIYTQFPYDAYNEAIDILPFFYSSNLKNYTKELIYIPYFIIDEIVPTDERAVKSLQYFCTMPGVVHADKVIVQSEQMKKTYVNALTEFAGEHTRNIWEEKIKGTGSPLNDITTEVNLDDLPDGWKQKLYDENGNKKKVIFYYTGIGNLIEKEGAMIDKIERTLEKFKAQKNLAIIWSVHPRIRVAIENSKPLLWKRYQTVVERYKAEEWGIFAEHVNAKELIGLCDGYYGDTSELIVYFKKIQIPVMVHDVSI